MASILFIAPQAKFFLSHRLPLALAARDAGYQVAVACPDCPDCARIRECGLIHFDLPVARAGWDPIREIRTLVALNRLLARFRPDLLHLITAKATLYGGLLARMRDIPAVAAITGLGFLFVGGGVVKRASRNLLLWLYRVALNRPASCVIFQNEHDRKIFLEANILERCRELQLPGAGVDLTHIYPRPLPPGQPIVMLPARMLRMKGVEDFRAAAILLKDRGVNVSMRLVGDPDPDNPTTLTRGELVDWTKEGFVEWEAHRRDIGALLASAHVIALPSHGGEGLPKTLVDAAAAGRAMVASDVPGCRDAIVAGTTGLLCRPRDPRSLADAIEALLRDPDRVRRMGRAAREDAERRFDITRVISEHLRIYDQLSSAAMGG